MQEAHALAARIIRSAGRRTTMHNGQKPTAINHSADNPLLEIEQIMGNCP
jgi:hypothetical protein